MGEPADDVDLADGDSFLAVPALIACTTSNFSNRPSLPVPLMDAGSTPSERTRNITAGDRRWDASELGGEEVETEKERSVEERRGESRDREVEDRLLAWTGRRRQRVANVGNDMVDADAPSRRSVPKWLNNNEGDVCVRARAGSLPGVRFKEARTMSW